jgi:hypothetical protein
MQYRFRTEAPYGLYIGAVPHAHADAPPLPLVCGFIESWWYPRPLFLVFVAPRDGEEFTLSYGRPLCHVLVVKAGSETLRHMDEAEIADEVRREQAYQAYLEAHPHLRWRSADGAGFSRLYKRFSARARRGDPLG